MPKLVIIFVIPPSSLFDTYSCFQATACNLILHVPNTMMNPEREKKINEVSTLRIYYKAYHNYSTDTWYFLSPDRAVPLQLVTSDVNTKSALQVAPKLSYGLWGLRLDNHDCHLLPYLMKLLPRSRRISQPLDFMIGPMQNNLIGAIVSLVKRFRDADFCFRTETNLCCMQSPPLHCDLADEKAYIVKFTLMKVRDC